jgi:F-type H+-transporting ATPase subunit a
MMKAILAAIILFVAPVLLMAAELEKPVAAAVVAEHESGPLVSPGALPIFPNVPWLTNSMIYTLIIGAIILAIIRLGTRNMKEIPSGLQNVIEAAVEGLENLTKGLLEAKVARWCFPLVATYFIFIVFSNLMGLLPGVGSIGYGPAAKDSSMPFAIEHAVVPFLRPPTADANMTIAMSLIFFIMSTYWAVKYNGVWGLIKHIFGPKGGLKGAILIPLSIIFALVGVIEVVSLLIRPVALAMRLYGNIYGGESVLALMLHKCYGLAAVPFYFLELVVAVVQAMVFTILCIAFISTLCSHSEEEGHAKEH